MQEPCCRVYPAMHSQTALLTAECALASQVEHHEDPSDEKVPSTHRIHNVLGYIVEPPGQLEHSDVEAAPVVTGKYCPDGQATHVPAAGGQSLQLLYDDAPFISEYLPAPHNEQLDEPTLSP